MRYNLTNFALIFCDILLGLWIVVHWRCRRFEKRVKATDRDF